MNARPYSSASIVPAAVLALLTLLVFYVLQDYGPESALRKFHEAALKGDSGSLDRVSVGGSADQVTREAAATVQYFLKDPPSGGGGRYRLLRTDHRGRTVGAEAVYVFPSGQTKTIYWIVVKQGNRWRVDALATARLMSMPESQSRQ